MFSDSSFARRVLNMEQPNDVIWGDLDYSHIFMSSWWTDSVMHHVTRSVSFDECMNKISQNEQMDLIVRYWDSDIGQDSVRYMVRKLPGATL